MPLCDARSVVGRRGRSSPLVPFPLNQWAPSIKNAEDSLRESRSAESSEITRNNRTALNLSPSKPARSLQKKYGDAFENDFRARLGVLKKIHSRFIARPLNRFTHVESIQPGFQVLSNGHESIQRTRFNGFKFNRRRPVAESHSAAKWHKRRPMRRIALNLFAQSVSFILNNTKEGLSLRLCWCWMDIMAFQISDLLWSVLSIVYTAVEDIFVCVKLPTPLSASFHTL